MISDKGKQKHDNHEYVLSVYGCFMTGRFFLHFLTFNLIRNLL